jgi:uncharacterized protein (TIGR00255 family)
MSISSMTGFARIENAMAGWTWVWEVRSVNGRGLDVRARIPNGFSVLEAKVRAAGKAAFSRGNLQVSLQYQRLEETGVQVVREDLARLYVQALQPLVDDGLVQPARVDGVLGIRGIIDTPRIDDEPQAIQAITDAMQAGIVPLFEALALARKAEGEATGKVIAAALDEIEALVARAGKCASARPEAIKEKLQTQISDLLDGQEFDSQRLAQEAALMAVKADVSEELDRLNAHIVAARALLDMDEPVGRKLEFLTQEFNREANTLCSKSSDLTLTDIGLALKTKIDQVREQAANVE